MKKKSCVYKKLLYLNKMSATPKKQKGESKTVSVGGAPYASI